jgi:hypothetical protein
MSWTDRPPGSRPNCSACGGHRWSFGGYCLSVECNGNFRDPDYPRNLPRAEAVTDTGPTEIKKVKMPRKGTRRSTELWYESQGRVAPWLEKKDNPT